MTNPDLESLRIERGVEEPSGGGVSPLWKYLCLLLLPVLASGGLYVWSVLPPPGSSGAPTTVEPARRGAATAPASTARENPSPGFTASGWVKLPLDFPVRVTPLIEGRVESIAVIEGDRVTAGEELARLYDVDLRAELAAAEARVAEARATQEKLSNGARPQEVSAARAEVERIEAELAAATEVLAHSRDLQPKGAIPLEELQRDAASARALAAQLARAKEQLALLVEGFRREEIALAEASLARATAERDLARLRLDYAVVESPIDGVVIERTADVGEWLTPRGGGIARLYDPERLEVRVDVNQDDLARVAIGQRVEITSRAEPGVVHPGRVVRIEPRADEVKNTVPVRVAIEGAGGRLLYPDMVVKVRFLDTETSETTRE